MRVVSHRIHYPSRKSVLKIIPIGDVHGGHVNCDEELLDEAIEEVAGDKMCRWIGLGDMVEAIWRKDVRHRESSYAEWLHGEDRVFAAQREWVIEKLKPIAGKCLGYIVGNHEAYALKKFGVDMYHTVMEELFGEDRVGEYALGVHGFIRLTLGRRPGKKTARDSRNLFIYAHHGFGGGDLAGGKALKLERLAGRYDAHLYLMGHLHVLQVVTGNRVYPKTRVDDVEERHWKAVCTGAFLRSIVIGEEDMYAEEKGYAPTAVGYPRIYVGCEDKNVRVEI